VSIDLAKPRALPRGPALVFGLLAVIGVGTFLYGLSVDAERTHRVFLHNWLLWAALSQGALVLSAAFRLTNARWQGPVHRVVDSMAAYVPLSFVLFLVVYLGRHELFAWIAHPVHGKEWWFSEGFTFARDTLALAWMTVLTLLYLYLSVRPMLGEARETATGRRGSLYQRWSSDWRGEATERELAERRLRKLAAVLVLSYALAYSLLAVDMIMSLAPHWVSTMFPAYYAWGGFLSAVSLTTLICLLLRNSEGLRGEVTPNRMHDLGKMIFAFSIFWMYLFWSQYLVIWYGNIPEETSFVVARLGSQFIQDTWYLQGFWTRIGEPYVEITLVTWILLWVVPFWVLLGQRPKRTPLILGAVAFGSLLGFWLERYVLVTPSLVSPAAVAEGAPVTLFGGIEVGLALGFIGAFFLCFLLFGRVFPGVLPATDGSQP
jgi:hypothetical protein